MDLISAAPPMFSTRTSQPYKRYKRRRSRASGKRVELNDDILSSVWLYLTLPELVLAMLVCRTWCTAAWNLLEGAAAWEQQQWHYVCCRHQLPKLNSRWFRVLAQHSPWYWNSVHPVGVLAPLHNIIQSWRSLEFGRFVVRPNTDHEIPAVLDLLKSMNLWHNFSARRQAQLTEIKNAFLNTSITRLDWIMTATTHSDPNFASTLALILSTFTFTPNCQVAVIDTLKLDPVMREPNQPSFLQTTEQVDLPVTVWVQRGSLPMSTLDARRVRGSALRFIRMECTIVLPDPSSDFSDPDAGPPTPAAFWQSGDADALLDTSDLLVRAQRACLVRAERMSVEIVVIPTSQPMLRLRNGENKQILELSLHQISLMSTAATLSLEGPSAIFTQDTTRLPHVSTLFLYDPTDEVQNDNTMSITYLHGLFHSAIPLSVRFPGLQDIFITHKMGYCKAMLRLAGLLFPEESRRCPCGACGYNPFVMDQLLVDLGFVGTADDVHLSPMSHQQALELGQICPVAGKITRGCVSLLLGGGDKTLTLHNHAVTSYSIFRSINQDHRDHSCAFGLDIDVTPIEECCDIQTIEAHLFLVPDVVDAADVIAHLELEITNA